MAISCVIFGQKTKLIICDQFSLGWVIRDLLTLLFLSGVAW